MESKFARSAPVPNWLSDAYEGLVSSLQNAGENSGCGSVRCPRPPKGAFRPSNKKGHAIFDCTVFLRQWKWRASSRSTDTIDIWLHSQEVIQLKPDLILVKSTVRVSYYEVAGQTAKLTACVHYDHSSPPQDDQHPFFHAQMAPDSGEADDELKNFFDYGTIQRDSFRPFKFLRIPTADMTFGSVLLCLAADHLQPLFFKQFREKFCSLQDRLPHPSIDDFRWSFGLGGTGQHPAHLKSAHWYARRPNCDSSS